MATRKKSPEKRSKADDREKRTSRTRTYFSRARAASKKTGIRWGEAALAAIVGYEGNKILDGVGVGNLAYPYLSKYGPVNDAMGEVYQETGGTNGQNADVVINKTAGLAAILKSVYDVVKKHRLDDIDKNIFLPYAIGTIFDAPKKESSGGRWQ